MTAETWDTLLTETRRAWSGHRDLTAFCTFPERVMSQTISPRARPAARLFQTETGLAGRAFADLVNAARAAGPLAHWRDTYAATNIDPDFLDRFGCFALIGPGGPFGSDVIRAWFVYMPARLYYPWHHHPAEEAYLVLDGEATFRRTGRPDITLGEGAILFHGPMESHSMETGPNPILALVVWRADFDQGPVLTHPDAR